MKKTLLFAASLLMMGSTAMAETITLNNKDYEIQRLIEHQIGPGTTYLRMRLPAYPLNVNVVMVDLNDPYNRIETTVAKESSRGTESLVTAAKRQSSEGHRPLAAANANFWIVATQPEEFVFSGITRNVSLRNGKMITESNQNRDQWDGGTMRTGIVSVSYDKVLNIDYCTSTIKVWSDKFGPTEVHQCNKGVWNDEIGMYNSHYGASTQFMPIHKVSGKYQIDEQNDATEVILDFDEGQEWLSGQEMTFVVKEVRLDQGRGTLGNHDLALVGRGANRELLAGLAEGDKVTMKYSWTFNPGEENEVTPLVENAVGGNALVMRNGELTPHNYNETYNSQVYSRTGYGCSADNKTLYMVVIDKSSDPVYGTSAGCSTEIMCLIAKHLGCSNMATFDAGGSAELMVNNAIVNKTTEASPRAVANGWMIFSTAPEDDNDVARLEFSDYSLEQPVYTSSAPVVIAYNKYGAVIDYDFKDFTLSCDPAIGTCDGSVFVAGSTPGQGLLTATCGEVTVSKEMTVLSADLAMRSAGILIDNYRQYPLEVIAAHGDRNYAVDPAHLAWTVADPSVATIDENGVLRGIANGSTTISGTLGNFTAEATVTVEIPTAASMLITPLTGWTVKGASGMTDVAMAEDGTITYSFGKKTAGHIEVSQKDVYVYSLPDALYTEFNSTIPVASITVDLLPANASRPVSYKVQPDGGFAADTDHNVDLLLDENVDLEDMTSFPMECRRLRYTFETLSTNQGAQTFRFGGVYASYKHYDGVEDITVATEAKGASLALSCNPAEAGSTVAVHGRALSSVAVYSISGALVATVPAADDAAVFTAPAAGTYIVAALTADGPASAILLVK